MSSEKPVTVIGAGLSGLALSRVLIREGFQVVLHEKGAEVAVQASGNPAGIYKPILTRSATAQSRLSFQALGPLQAELSRLTSEGLPLRRGEGLIQLAISADEELKLREAFRIRSEDQPDELAHAGILTSKEASERLGYPVPFGGVLWKRGGWVSPKDLCLAWLEELRRSPRFELRLRSDFPLDPSLWPTRTSGGVFVCAGPQSRSLPEFERFPHQLIRGQLSEIRFQEASFPDLSVGFHEYIIPLGSGSYALGATHDRGDLSTVPRSEDHRRLLERFGERIPAHWRGRSELTSPVSLRAGIRFTSQSRIPYCGALPLSAEKSGLPSFALTAQGSRGILWVVLLSEVLASWARDQESVLDPDSDLCHLLRGPSVATS